MTDIAREASVSQATVSLVLNGRANSLRISAATQEKILRIAKERGYTRNEIARAMVTGKTRLVGFASQEDGSERVSRIMRGALECAEQRGYFLKLLNYTPGHEEDFVRRCVENRLASVILHNMPERIIETLGSGLEKSKIPLVVLESKYKGAICRITTHYTEIFRCALSHLKELGHTRIAFFFGNPEVSSAPLARNAFESVMEELNLPRESALIRSNEVLDMTVEELLTDVMQDRMLAPTAILCKNDSIAMRVIRGARSLGMRLPDDLSVISVNDLSYAEWTDPALTSVRIPFEELGKEAVSALIKWMDAKDDKKPKLEDVEVNGNLVGRNSTALLGSVYS